jgi:hypothetical protein
MSSPRRTHTEEDRADSWFCPAVGFHPDSAPHKAGRHPQTCHVTLYGTTKRELRITGILGSSWKVASRSKKSANAATVAVI